MSTQASSETQTDLHVNEHKAWLAVGVYKGTNGCTILKHEGFIMNMRVEGTVGEFPLCSDQGLLLLEELFYMQIQLVKNQ